MYQVYHRHYEQHRARPVNFTVELTLARYFGIHNPIDCRCEITTNYRSYLLSD